MLIYLHTSRWLSIPLVMHPATGVVADTESVRYGSAALNGDPAAFVGDTKKIQDVRP